jgi:uncharacterized membrane protein
MKTFLQKTIGLFLFPAMLLIAAKEISVYYPQYVWMQIITILTITIVGLIITKGFSDYRTNRKVLINLLLVGTSAYLIMLRLNTVNSEVNHLDLLSKTIAIAVLVIGLAGLTQQKISKRVLRVTVVNVSWFNKLIAVIACVCLCLELYFHFGTQYVWISTLFLTGMTIIFVKDEEVDDFLDDNSWVAVLIATPLVIAITSTVYQFWFSQIIFGYTLWLLLSALVIVAILITVVILIVQFIKQQKENAEEAVRAEEYKQKRAQELEEQRNKDQEALKIAKDFGKKLLESEELSWDDVLYLYRLKDDKEILNILNKLVRKIPTLPLQSFLKVSTIKQQLAWNSATLNLALQLLDNAAKNAFDDEFLQLLIKQLQDFIETNEPYENFNGYRTLQHDISYYCTTIYRLLPAKKSAELDQ